MTKLKTIEQDECLNIFPFSVSKTIVDIMCKYKLNYTISDRTVDAKVHC